MRVNAKIDWMMAITGEVIKVAIPFLILMTCFVIASAEAFYAHAKYQHINYHNADHNNYE